MSKEARGKADAELKKLRMMSPMSAEATVVRNYIDWILSVPWKKRSKISRDLNRAEEILEADHYGLEKVKERILEYLAVQQRVKKMKGPIFAWWARRGRQDIAGPLDRPRDQSQICTHVLGRRPR